MQFDILTWSHRNAYVFLSVFPVVSAVVVFAPLRRVGATIIRPTAHTTRRIILANPPKNAPEISYDSRIHRPNFTHLQHHHQPTFPFTADAGFDFFAFSHITLLPPTQTQWLPLYVYDTALLSPGPLSPLFPPGGEVPWLELCSRLKSDSAEEDGQERPADPEGTIF